MPPKKAAKKVGKKAAKESVKKHHEGKDLRRAYEHLGRLGGLEKLVAAEVRTQIAVLTEAAQRSLSQGEQKTAADLLRAGEHLGFGSLASQAKAGSLSDDLASAIDAEYEHLVDKAEEHWAKHDGNRPVGIEKVYESMLDAANAAFGKGAYRRALEFARGAEALAHVRGGQMMGLEDGVAAKGTGRLRG
jgi:hypothetical protein